MIKQTALAGARNSSSFKVVFIGILILLLLIPVSMIQGVIHDRTRVSMDAQNDVMRSWGGEQRVAAPILVVPFICIVSNKRGEPVERRYRAYVLPKDLNIAVDLVPDTRYRGIHEVTVYSAVLKFDGEFRKATLDELPTGTDRILWDEAAIAVGVSDARAITRAPEIAFGAATAGFEPAGIQRDGLPPQIIANVGDPFASGTATFAFDLHLNGTGSLRLMPLGDTTNVAMTSAWASPSFVGAYLPKTRDVTEQGFDAHWQISSLGRSLPDLWIEGAIDADLAARSEFGVELYVPVGLYQLSLRATKYAVLFIGLSFVAYFLFEAVAKLRLHPLQYLLVGFANTIFYLLLMSLAEHIGFRLAYLLSALACIALITAYSAAVLGKRARASLMTLVLTLVYTFLYMTLKAETYAMLAGSIGLWLTLAIVMYLTRKVDWYRYSEKADMTEA